MPNRTAPLLRANISQKREKRAPKDRKDLTWKNEALGKLLHEDDRDVAMALSNASSSAFTKAFASHGFVALPIVTHRRVPSVSMNTVMLRIGQLTHNERYGVAFASPSAVKTVTEADDRGEIRALLAQCPCYAWGRSTQAALASVGVRSRALSSKSASKDLKDRILRTKEVVGVVFISGEVTSGSLSTAMTSADLRLENIPVYRMEENSIKTSLQDRLEKSIKSLLVLSGRSLETVCEPLNRNAERKWVVVPSERMKKEVTSRIPNSKVVIARSASPDDCARALKISLNTRRYHIKNT